MIDIKKTASLFEMRKHSPLTDWEDIKEGETYHLPPLLYNKRMDFVVLKKEDNLIRIMKDGSNYAQTLYKTDISTRFIVKKQK